MARHSAHARAPRFYALSQSKIANPYCNRLDDLAPHHGAASRTSSNSAHLSKPLPQNRGSWVKISTFNISRRPHTFFDLIDGHFLALFAIAKVFSDPN